ncbi:glycosyl hydrolase 53 family protein [Teredinibacter turnerae]|uniref:glycosyl hydrolase 53 family protein n=1 Tax=Teredinibacter turnerae TaxID=2426 RepID=UPI002E36AE74|nr:glycosyl hydrolase 53 family protein [Teredinibacter turnerae]
MFHEIKRPFLLSTPNWSNLGALLSAGIQGVNQIDPNIETVLHIENFDDPAGVEWWVDSALNAGVQFDVLGLSAYEEFQGPASAWRSTMQRLASRYPQLSFAIVEFNPRGRLLADIVREIPGGRGLGTFFWEPTESGYWGNAIFSQQGNSYYANSSDFAVYDQIVEDYGLRILQ